MRYLRADCSRITPLEVWELGFEGTPVWETLGALAVERRLQQGEDPREVGRSVADTARRFARRLRRGDYPTACAVERGSAVVFTGGLVRLPGFAALLETVDDIRIISRDRDVLLGGHRVLEVADHQIEAALVVDVGQTAIKSALVTSGGVQGRVRRFERPWDRLPVRTKRRRKDPSVKRAIEFISRAIDRSVKAAPIAPSALVLALPCEVDHQLNTGPCSYGDWSRWPRFGARVIEAADALATALPVVVLNDAELAAYAAFDALAGGDALVLTLGFGPGAAHIAEEADGG